MLKKVNHIVINLCHVTVGITGIQWRQWQRRDKRSVDINMSRLLQVLHVTPPDCYRMPEIEGQHIYDVECVKEVDRVMTWELSETIAAFIMEPIITGGGILMPPQDYMKAVHETCQNTVPCLLVMK